MNLANTRFTLADAGKSAKAIALKIDNTPPNELLPALERTATTIAKVESLLKHQIVINSWFRNPTVNKLVGSTNPKSQHTKGEAVDFICSSFGTPRQVVSAIKASSIEYDQVIVEFDSWVHISVKQTGNRKQALVINSKGTSIFV